MVYPTLHLNGTSKRDLLAALENAYDSLRAAKDALLDCRPNGRDYYPQGPDAWDSALAESFSREDRIESVLGEIIEMMTHVEEFGK